MQLMDFYNDKAFFLSLLFLLPWCLWLCKKEGKEPVTAKKELNCICLKVIWKLVQLYLKFQIITAVRRITHTLLARFITIEKEQSRYR